MKNDKGTERSFDGRLHFADSLLLQMAAPKDKPEGCAGKSEV
jgi:hypothetical protein